MREWSHTGQAMRPPIARMYPHAACAIHEPLYNDLISHDADFLMFLGLYQPADVVEEKGENYFIAAHPRPRVREPGFLQVMLGARHSLIGNWMEDHYRSTVDSFRILRRQVVFVNAPEHVKYVMVTRHANFERKSPQTRRALEMLLGDGLLISDGQTWRERRPLVADIVHKRRLPEFASTMEQAMSAAILRWLELPAGAEFELTADMAHLTAQVISRAVFGKNLGAQAARQVIEGFNTYQKGVESFNLGYFLGADDGWPLRRSAPMRGAVARVHQVIDDVIETHLRGDGDAASIVSLLLARKGRDGVGDLDIAALRNEAATIFMAGHEGTANTLTWAFYLIANAPWAERRLVEEIDALCGARAVVMDDVQHLDWCRSVILETLRLYPPVPLLPRQARAADRIADIEVEAGSLVMIAPWLLHRARDLWENPNHFQPQRFAHGAKYNPFAFIPFSVGPRICAGLNFGLDEAVLCLAALIQRFRVTPRPGYKVEPVCRLTLRPAGGLPVSVTPRHGRRLT